MFYKIKSLRIKVIIFLCFISVALSGQDLKFHFGLGKEYFQDREILLLDFTSIEPTSNIKRSGTFSYIGISKEINLFNTFQVVPELGLSYFGRPLTRRYSFPFGSEIMENLKLRSLRAELRIPLQIKIKKFSPKIGIATQQALFRRVVADNGVFKFKEITLDRFYYTNWSIFGQIDFELSEKYQIYIAAEEYFLNYDDIFDPFFETIRNVIRINIGVSFNLSKFRK